MRIYELIRSLCNHDIKTSNVKIRINNENLDIKEVYYTGLQNGDEIIIEVESNKNPIQKGSDGLDEYYNAIDFLKQKANKK
jgi:hypothetical protein